MSSTLTLLTQLGLFGCDIKAEQLQCLANLPKLRHLDLHGNGYLGWSLAQQGSRMETGSTAHTSGDCSSSNSSSSGNTTSSSEATSTSTEVLAANLQSSCKISNSSSGTSAFPDLCHLDLSGCALTTLPPGLLSQLTKLTALHLKHNSLTSSSLAQLHPLLQLQQLDLHHGCDPHLPAEALTALGRLSNLQDLDITGAPTGCCRYVFPQHSGSSSSNGQHGYGTAGAGSFTSARTGWVLGRLAAYNVGMSDADLLQMVSACPQLTELKIGGNAVTAAGLGSLSRLTQLKTLDASNQQMPIGDEGAGALASLTTLQEVVFIDNGMSSQGRLMLEASRGAFGSSLVKLFMGAS